MWVCVLGLDACDRMREHTTLCVLWFGFGGDRSTWGLCVCVCSFGGDSKLHSCFGLLLGECAEEINLLL